MDLISLVVWILVLGLVVGLVIWLIDMLPIIPAQFKMIAKAVLIVAVIIIILVQFLPGLPHVRLR